MTPPTEPTAALRPDDSDQLRARGIADAEARRQLALLCDPPPPPELVRPARADDGITRLPEAGHDALVERYERARAAGAATKFVPASGAASRMFKTLLPWVDYAGKAGAAAKEMSRRAVDGDPEAGDAVRFLSELARFPFYGELERATAAGGQKLETLRAQGDVGAVLHLLLSDDQLDYDGRPKALIPFHRYRRENEPDEVRTAFHEQLVEAALTIAGDDGTCRLHFTVPPEAREAIETHLDVVRERFGETVRFAVEFSVQSPATDTLALDPETGGPFRLPGGELLLRPGGHGALLENLAAVAGVTGRADELVFVKNIDNVQPDRVKDQVVRWKKILGGYLLELLEHSRALLARLEASDAGDDGVLGEAEAFLRERLSVELPEGFSGRSTAERRRALRDRLDRPVRVGGMVVNRGEPGGGPFWVRQDDGTVTAQIVEKAQVSEAPEQREIFAASTHFNPVDLVVSLVDRKGKPYDLQRFVDQDAVFVADKSHEGRPLRALERPGLWNGAMAGWNTAFVEVPEVTFSPVKTVFDLLRKEHQP